MARNAKSWSESARYAPPDAKERTCFHGIAGLTTLCKTLLFGPDQFFSATCTWYALMLAWKSAFVGWSRLKMTDALPTGNSYWTHSNPCLQLWENNIAWNVHSTSGSLGDCWQIADSLMRSETEMFATGISREIRKLYFVEKQEFLVCGFPVN